jgi:hypothetical protein
MSQKWRVNNKCANTAFDMLMTASQWVAILQDFESANGELDPAIPARIIRSLGAKWQQSYIITQVVQTLLKLKALYEEEKEVEADLVIDEEVKSRFDKLTKYLEANNLMRAFEILPLIQVSAIHCHWQTDLIRIYLFPNHSFRLVNSFICLMSSKVQWQVT